MKEALQTIALIIGVPLTLFLAFNFLVWASGEPDPFPRLTKALGLPDFYTP